MRGRRSKAESIRKTVVDALKQYPAGLHLRELSRKSKIPKSTLAYHLSRSLLDCTEEVKIAPRGKVIVRLIKLRDSNEI